MSMLFMRQAPCPPSSYLDNNLTGRLHLVDQLLLLGSGSALLLSKFRVDLVNLQHGFDGPEKKGSERE
jgi:hypothetical protein